MSSFFNEFKWRDALDLFNFISENDVILCDNRVEIMYGRNTDKKIHTINFAIRNHDNSIHQEIMISKGHVSCYPDTSHVEELKLIIKDIIGNIRYNIEYFN